VRNAIFSTNKLKSFLGASGSTEVDLVLPVFQGNRYTVADRTASRGTKLIYPGNVYSDRDTKSAFHISSLLGRVMDEKQINLTGTIDFNFATTRSELVFLFGSKSNPLTENLLVRASNSHLFSLEFGLEWSIRSFLSNRTYAIADPSTLTSQEYEAQTDYGIIARFLPENPFEKTAFIVAGLGSRATEGCSLFFCKQWKQINSKFAASKIAAVVLKFRPPVSPSGYNVEEWITS